MTTIGFIGAGNIGQSVARLAVDHGYDVVLSNSRGPETLADVVAGLGPHADADTAAGAAERGDLVVVTVPFKAYRDVPAEPLAGKVVVDTNNYYPARDGQVAELDEKVDTSAGMLQAHLPDSHVVKAFNHIMSSHLLEHGQPAGTAGRRALAIAGDDAESKATVARLIDELGFDVVDVGPLAESWRIEPGTPGYGARLDAEEMREALAAAER
jgi:8-hydroxy-5-deazaflavin:NADPH oxidoreductase